MSLTKDVYVTTGKVRFGYVTLVEPKTPKNSDVAKFSLMLMIPKSDKQTLKELRQAEKNAYEAAVTAKWGGKRPKMKSIIKDGDGTKDNGEPYGDECKDHYVMNVSSTRRVPVVDRHNSIIDPADVKSGDYGRANINAFGYSGEARGVTFGLNLVQFLREGDPLGGGISVEAAFGDPFEDDDDEDDEFEFEFDSDED